jgi:hypothetical protein
MTLLAEGGAMGGVEVASSGDLVWCFITFQSPLL